MLPCIQVSSSPAVFSSYISEVHHFWWDFCICDCFLIQPFTCLGHECQESMRCNAYVYWPELSLYSHLKEFWGNGVRTHRGFPTRMVYISTIYNAWDTPFWSGILAMLILKEKAPLREKFSSEEDQSHDAASSRTMSRAHYQWAIPAPHSGFNELIFIQSRT